jgi:phosphonopyruvate decarboxylase
MRRDEAIEVLAEGRADAPSVATMQTVPPWHASGQGARDHLDALGCMGSASALGLGLALARPERKVLVLDGDGSLLMQLGSLVTIAAAAPPNFYHFVFENGVYETSGNQEVPGLGKFDFAKLARAAGYPGSYTFADDEELRKALPRVLSEPGPILVRLLIERESTEATWPQVRMADQVRALREQFAPSREEHG